MFSWEAPWHSFSNSEAFLIRDCQSRFSVQSHIAYRHHFPQNLIQSSGLVFLVNSSKPKPLMSRKDSSASGKRCFALSKKAPINKPKNHTQDEQKTKPENPSQSTQKHTQDFSHWNYFSLLSDYHEDKSSIKVFNCLLFYKVRNDTSCLMMFVELTLQAHRSVWIVWNVLRHWNNLSNFSQTG